MPAVISLIRGEGGKILSVDCQRVPDNIYGLRGHQVEVRGSSVKLVGSDGPLACRVSKQVIEIGDLIRGEQIIRVRGVEEKK